MKHGGRVVNRLGRGDFLGEIALVTGQQADSHGHDDQAVPAARGAGAGVPDAAARPSGLQLKVLDALAARLPKE